MGQLDNTTDFIASKFLGKRVESFQTYEPSLLVAVPRVENRKMYDINEEDLPFEGFDIWHAYEFSTLTKTGFPVTRVIKLRYSCDSEYIVESKSLKLYLNSFNMSKFGQNTIDCLKICKNIIEKDISEKLQTAVELEFLSNSYERVQIFDKYENLENLIGENLCIDKFKESPEILFCQRVNENQEEYYLTFDSLRSNCRVTHQPDFGDVFIYYKSRKMISYDSLVKYLISFRSEYHFHEECCEMIYKRLYDILDKDDRLMVCALYTRRGGIDISPVRCSKNFSNSDIESLIDLKKFARYGIKQ